MSNTSFPALQNNPSTPPVSKTRMITLIGVFAAISTILMFIEMPLPLMPPFLKIDLSGVPILIIGFMYGPMPAIYVTIIKDLVHMLSSQTGCVGELADILVLSSFAVVSSLVFRKNPSQKSAALSMAAGAATITVVGSLANKFMLIPFYSKIMPLEAIIDACHAVNPMIDSMDAYVLFGSRTLQPHQGHHPLAADPAAVQKDVRLHPLQDVLSLEKFDCTQYLFYSPYLQKTG